MSHEKHEKKLSNRIIKIDGWWWKNIKLCCMANIEIHLSDIKIRFISQYSELCYVTGSIILCGTIKTQFSSTGQVKIPGGV